MRAGKLFFASIVATVSTVIGAATFEEMFADAGKDTMSAAVTPTPLPQPHKPMFDLTDVRLIGDKLRLRDLSKNLAACREALTAVGVSFAEAPGHSDKRGCGYTEAVSINEPVSMDGGALVATCGLAARLELWRREAVQPAAEKYFGVKVKEIEAFGTYSCRCISGSGTMSEHASANAADISAFILEDGRRISVLKDFRAKGAAGKFLHEVRDEACDIFSVTLSPDYNADHANHLHLDAGKESVCH